MLSSEAQKSGFLMVKLGAWESKALLSVLCCYMLSEDRAGAGNPAGLCQVSSEWLACRGVAERPGRQEVAKRGWQTGVCQC